MHSDRLEQLTAALSSADGSISESLRVAQVMTHNPACISANLSVLDLVKLFHSRGFRHQLVADERGQLLGVISDRDVIRCFGPGQNPPQELLARITAGEIMSSDLVTVQPQTCLEQALKLLLDYGINCLPVVEDGTVVGILTTTDMFLVLRAMMKIRPAADVVETPVAASCS